MRSCVLGLLAAAGLCLMPLPPDGAWAATMDDAPKFVEPETDAVPKGTRVDVLADRLTYDGKSKIARATGTVQLTYGPYVLTATEVVYDMKKGKFSANGSIVFREPNGNVMEADFAELEDTFKEGFARHVTALLTNDVTITAQYAQALRERRHRLREGDLHRLQDLRGRRRNPALADRGARGQARHGRAHHVLPRRAP